MEHSITPEEYAVIRKETDAAIEKGLDATRAEWRAMALQELHKVCKSKATFTVNDVRDAVLASNIKTHDNRAMGGVMQMAKRLGWIAPSGQSIPSRVGHLVHIQIWRSLLYKGVPGPDAPPAPKIDRFE